MFMAPIYSLTAIPLPLLIIGIILIRKYNKEQRKTLESRIDNPSVDYKMNKTSKDESEDKMKWEGI